MFSKLPASRPARRDGARTAAAARAAAADSDADSADDADDARAAPSRSTTSRTLAGRARPAPATSAIVHVKARARGGRAPAPGADEPLAKARIKAPKIRDDFKGWLVARKLEWRAARAERKRAWRDALLGGGAGASRAGGAGGGGDARKRGATGVVGMMSEAERALTHGLWQVVEVREADETPGEFVAFAFTDAGALQRVPLAVPRHVLLNARRAPRARAATRARRGGRGRRDHRVRRRRRARGRSARGARERGELAAAARAAGRRGRPLRALDARARLPAARRRRRGLSELLSHPDLEAAYGADAAALRACSRAARSRASRPRGGATAAAAAKARGGAGGGQFAIEDLELVGGAQGGARRGVPAPERRELPPRVRVPLAERRGRDAPRGLVALFFLDGTNADAEPEGGGGGGGDAAATGAAAAGEAGAPLGAKAPCGSPTRRSRAAARARRRRR